MHIPKDHPDDEKWAQSANEELRRLIVLRCESDRSAGRIRTEYPPVGHEGRFADMEGRKS